MKKNFSVLALLLACAGANLLALEHPEHPSSAQPSRPRYEPPPKATPAPKASPQRPKKQRAVKTKKRARRQHLLNRKSKKAFARSVKDHIAEVAEQRGAFIVDDEKLDREWHLKLLRIHEKRIVVLGDGLYFACADFKEVKKKGKAVFLDLDFYSVKTEEGWTVYDVAIHKVNGKPRYVYNSQNERVSVVDLEKSNKAKEE